MPKISCVMPVYNEGPRIAKALSVVASNNLLSEVIVVDDGSKDNSAEEVKKFPFVRLITHPQNRGKTQAMITGIKASTGDFLLFVDSDLIGLTGEALNALMEPVLRGAADTSISLRKNSPWLDRKIGIDIFSGERVISKKLIMDNLAKIAKLPRFGFESFLNKLIIKNKLRLKIVWWPNVISPWKFNKTGLWAGVKGDAKMFLDILKTIPPWQIAWQFYALKKLNVKK